jgi:hypothetical protein
MRPVVVYCPVAGLNSSAVAKQLLLTLGPPPPAPKTSPFGSGVAVANTRATDMLPVGFHLPQAGLKSWALARDSPLLVLVIPPATRNSLVFRAVEVCRARAVFMLPVNENVPGTTFFRLLLLSRRIELGVTTARPTATSPV